MEHYTKERLDAIFRLFDMRHNRVMVISEAFHYAMTVAKDFDGFQRAYETMYEELSAI